MFFTNKWANLAVIVAVAVVVTIIVVNKLKVLDANNKATAYQLGFSAAA